MHDENTTCYLRLLIYRRGSFGVIYNRKDDYEKILFKFVIEILIRLNLFSEFV